MSLASLSTAIECVFSRNHTSDTTLWLDADKTLPAQASTTNLPLSNGIKIVSLLQRLHSEIWRTICDVQKRDEQTDRQTDQKTQRFWPSRRRVKSEPHQTWHGDRLEDLEHVRAPPKLLGSDA